MRRDRKGGYRYLRYVLCWNGSAVQADRVYEQLSHIYEFSDVFLVKCH